jgi:hypothetical protein
VRAARPLALSGAVARGRMVPDMPDIGVDELELLIRTQCLAESADRRAVGCATRVRLLKINPEIANQTTVVAT